MGSEASKPDHLTWQEWVDALRAICRRFPNDPLSAMRLAVAEKQMKDQS